MNTAIIDCRNTGHGAHTYVTRGDKTTIHEFAFSKTGNHWKTEVEGEPGAQFGVVDISNTGKHGCYVAHLAPDNPAGYEIVEQNDPASPQCIVCVP